MNLLCVCDEEFCWCGTLVWVNQDVIDRALATTGRSPDVACDNCKAGKHVMAP